MFRYANRRSFAKLLAHYEVFKLVQTVPGHIVESGPTDVIFSDPRDPRTLDYVQGRFG